MTEFKAGDAGRIGWVEWRVVQGAKSASDKRLDIRCREFKPVKMALGFLFADFYASNEEALARDGYLAKSVIGNAGRMYLDFLAGAQRPEGGWESAAAVLEAQRDWKKAA